MALTCRNIWSLLYRESTNKVIQIGRIKSMLHKHTEKRGRFYANSHDNNNLNKEGKRWKKTMPSDVLIWEEIVHV